MHRGIDYGAPTGTPVLATAPGSVVLAGWCSAGTGNCVVIDHGDGWRSQYFHLSRVSVETGDEVEHALAIADIEFVVMEIFDQLGEALLIPARVALRTEENGALVIVDAVDFPSKVGKMETDFRADEARGSSDE